jgi:hypothetical protein
MLHRYLRDLKGLGILPYNSGFSVGEDGAQTISSEKDLVAKKGLIGLANSDSDAMLTVTDRKKLSEFGKIRTDEINVEKLEQIRDDILHNRSVLAEFFDALGIKEAGAGVRGKDAQYQFGDIDIYKTKKSFTTIDFPHEGRAEPAEAAPLKEAFKKLFEGKREYTVREEDRSIKVYGHGDEVAALFHSYDGKYQLSVALNLKLSPDLPKISGGKTTAPTQEIDDAAHHGTVAPGKDRSASRAGE